MPDLIPLAGHVLLALEDALLYLALVVALVGLGRYLTAATR